jgi:hypothetical protein
MKYFAQKEIKSVFPIDGITTNVNAGNFKIVSTRRR